MKNRSQKMKPRMVEPLSIDVRAGEAGAVLTVNGRVTIDSSPVLRDRLLAILRQESFPALTIDLTAVPYVDSSGLATLVEALKFARAVKTTLQLRLHEKPLYLLKVTGVLPLFDASPGATASHVSKDDV
jgi:anti-sigma B factor antagonist